MNYLLIENKGELDINSLILVGASTKRSDNTKIGMFGSGNKYAIATLIKHSIPFKIFSGEREVVITTKSVIFRDQHFSQIFIDDKETSLTSDMGPQWEPWMAVREFVSNSLDEGNSNIITSIDNISSREGVTRIYIEHNPLIQKVITHWSEYFSFDRTDSIVDNKEGRIFANNSSKDELVLYRKGIRCIPSTTRKSLFHYDLNDFSINESRILNSGNGYSEASRFLANHANNSVARSILANSTKRANVGDNLYYEAYLYYDWYTLNDNWRTAVGDRTIIVDALSGFYIDIIQKQPCFIVPYSLAKAIKKSFPEIKVLGTGDENGRDASFKTTEVSEKMKFLIKEALHFLDETKYSVAHPIEVVRFHDNNILGHANDGKIYLADRLFESGKRAIVATIIEENEHLLTKYEDQSRAFQNHFINLAGARCEPSSESGQCSRELT